MSEFFAMGGYALYVWGSYGLAALLLGGLLLTSIRLLRTEERTLKALEAAQGERRRRRSRGTMADDSPATGQEDGT